MTSKPCHACFPGLLVCGFALCLVLGGTGRALGQNAVLQLKGGDQISGVILSVDTNQVVISNAWAGSLSVPVAQIGGCKAGTNPPVRLAETLAAAETHKPAGLHPATAKPASLLAAKPKETLKGQVNVGLDSLVAKKTQQNYYGKLQLTYVHPYASAPKKSFKNSTQITGQYQRTDGQESANRVNGNNKTDFDFAGSYYGYGSIGAGFDDVRKINFQYQLGPGLGRHMVRTDRTALNFESGIQYEVQHRRHKDDLESAFLRLAEDWTWQVMKNLSLNQKLAFYSNMGTTDLKQYRLDFNSTLSYGFWKNLSLDLSLDESYNTQVASGVSLNEFETRLSLGAKF